MSKLQRLYGEQGQSPWLDNLTRPYLRDGTLARLVADGIRGVTASLGLGMPASGAFLGVGKVDEARHFLAWLRHASRLDRPRLPVLLTLDGRHPTPEHELAG